MKRKLVKQGNNAYTITLPKKWITSHNLTKGEEIIIFSSSDSLVLTPNKLKQTNANIINNSNKEVIFRIMISNAYRSGYEKITLNTETFSNTEIETFTNKYLLGFETYKINKNTYSLEETLIPKNEKIQETLQKYFTLYKTLFEQLFTNDIENLVEKIQKYDNYIRRIISKETISQQKNYYLWNLLTHFLFAARETLHLQEKNKKIHKQNKIKNNTYTNIEKQIQSNLKEINNNLINYFFKNDIESFEKVINLSNEFLSKLTSPNKIPKEISHSTYTLTKHLYLLANLIQGYHISNTQNTQNTQKN
jgi:phosphate uptake regulator